MFCNVSPKCVFQSIDQDSIYKVPLDFNQQGLDQKICELLGIWSTTPKIEDLKQVINNIDHPKDTVKIGVVGKYTELTESYKSLDEALTHGAIDNQLKLEMVYIDSENIDLNMLSSVSGILVPGGFGTRGIEGKIEAIKYARENKIPFFGICLGMQLAMIEYARNVLGIKDATSMEFSSTGEHIIHFMEGQSESIAKGGSMRLGAFDCEIEKDSLAAQIYGEERISERHRHRLEVNNKFVDQFMTNGMKISGKNKELNLVEVIELPDHPYFIACQYHPEFKSGPFNPHPLFKSFVKAAYNEKGKHD